jgi:predicted CoA-binding protein
MTEAEQILSATNIVLIVDWPSRDVPDSLTRSGFTVIVKGGPEPDRYSAQELSEGEVVVRPLGRPPERADLVYAHRPFAELPGIVTLALALGAGAVWRQSGLAGLDVRDPRGCWLPEAESLEGRKLVESAAMRYVDDTYIADAARQLRGQD